MMESVISEDEDDDGPLTPLAVTENLINDEIGIGDDALPGLMGNRNSDNIAEPPYKRKRTKIDLKTKLEIVEKYEGGQRTAALSEEYGISQRRIYDFFVAVKKARAAQGESGIKDTLTIESEENSTVMLRPWVDNYAVHASDYEGYVTSQKMLKRLLQEFELDTKSTFIVKKSNRNYGKEVDLKHLHGKIRWQDTHFEARPQLDCDGIPFVIMGTCTLDCEFGPDREQKRRALRADMHEKMKDLPPHARKQRRRSKATKKLGCQAKIYIRHIVKFPQYEFADCVKDRRQREIMAFRMHHDFKRKDDIEIEHQYHVQLPSHHNNHSVGLTAPVISPIDHHLAAYIHKAVIEDCMYSSRELKAFLREYMLSSEELFKDKSLPPRTNSRFWPTLIHIRNHMLFALMRQRDSYLDQSNLETMVSQWQQDWPNDYFFLRFKPDHDLELPNIETQEENILSAMNPEIAIHIVGGRQRFLFVHQTSWQRDLLRMYGNEVCILDASYRSLKCPLPLFFVVVPTNISYIIAATLILETEDRDSLQEALGILCNWNPEWAPRYFLTDFSSEERTAVENTFCDYHTVVYICDYHRLRSWEKWLSSRVNRVSQFKECMLMLFKDVAESETEEEFQENLQILEGSEVWQNNTHLRQWFQTNWLTEKMKWVKTFREEQFNAINTHNSRLKREGLVSLDTENIETVSQLIYIMINVFLPDIYQWYLRENIKCSSEVQALGNSIPAFMKSRPIYFVRHIKKRWSDAQELKNGIIKTANNSVFHVSSSTTSQQEYCETHIDDGEGSPRCTYKDWQAYHYPCKHILAVIAFKNHPSIIWDCLPESYRNSPFVTLHLSLVVCTIKVEKDKLETLPATDGAIINKTVLTQNLAKKVRSLAGEVDGLTYLCQDPSCCKS